MIYQKAPYVLQFFQTVGNTRRNADGDDLAVKEIKGVVSLCTPLNARSIRAMGIQLLFSIMLIA